MYCTTLCRGIYILVSNETDKTEQEQIITMNIVYNIGRSLDELSHQQQQQQHNTATIDVAL